MTQEDKQLLLKDLCARLPYGVICDRLGKPKKLLTISPSAVFSLQLDNGEYAAPCYTIEEAKPYLRPISSMTEEEKINYRAFFNYDRVEYPDEYIDWLNKNMFDYRELIEKGLAIEVTEENNPYKD